MFVGILRARRGTVPQHYRRRFKPYFKSTTTATTTATVAAMLIDVDCNLWHTDLPSLCFDGGVADPALRTPFSILDHDDMSQHRALLSPSSTLADARRGLEYLSMYNGPIAIKTTVGVHPYHVNDADQVPIKQFMEEAQALILNDTAGYIAAIGECGLDASEDFPPLQDQVPWFKAQIELAESVRLPLFVHDRLTRTTTSSLLQDVTVPVIVHCFTGDAEDCQEYIRQGFSISISGFILRKEGQRIRDCVQEGIIPLDKLMIETDAPYMGFTGCREAYLNKNADHVATLKSKTRKGLSSAQYPNPPSSLHSVFLHVLHHLNEGRGRRGEELLTRDEFARITTDNANRFFGFNLEV
jgi:TatD DNase family protein